MSSNAATLVLNSLFTSNLASGAQSASGGALLANGTLTMESTQFVSNSARAVDATAQGGGAFGMATGTAG